MEVLAAVTKQSPHYIMNYSLSEWSSIVAIVIAVSSIIAWIVRVAVTKPMENSNKMLDQTIRDLAKKVNGIGLNADHVHADHDSRLDKHDLTLTRHDIEIGTLYDKTGLTRRKKDEN